MMIHNFQICFSSKLDCLPCEKQTSVLCPTDHHAQPLKLVLTWRMLKEPRLKSSGLYIQGFQDMPDRGALDMLKFLLFLDKPQAYTSRTYMKASFRGHILYEKKNIYIYFANPKQQISVFLISDRYCRHRSVSYIIIPIDVGLVFHKIDDTHELDEI